MRFVNHNLRGQVGEGLFRIRPPYVKHSVGKYLRQRIQELFVKGDLSQDTLAGVICGLYLDRKSGILHLEQEGIKKRIYFKKGSMIFANSDVDDDRIGEFLIRNNAIDRAAFEMAAKVAKDTKKRFGKTVGEMGHMSADEMETHVTGQI